MFSKAKGTIKSAAPSSSIPPYFLCPITNQIMSDPCIGQCGHMFEREAIIELINEVPAFVDTSDPYILNSLHQRDVQFVRRS
jgi:hypothetical protein